jgi:two-component system, chemotaxis family, sensor kinase CheA
MNADEIQNIFLIECDEGLGVAEEGLMACQSGTGDAETINGIFRAVHSIKGGAGAFGFTALQAFTHKFETVLQQVRDGDRDADQALLGVMLRAFDTLTDHVSAVKGECDTPDDAAISAELEKIAAGPVVESAPEPTAGNSIGADLDFDSLLADLDLTGDEKPQSERNDWTVALRPQDGALKHGGEPLRLLRELVQLGGHVVKLDVSSLKHIDAFDPEAAMLSWTISVPGDVERSAIEEIFDFSGDEMGFAIVADNNQPELAPLEDEPPAPSSPPPTPLPAAVPTQVEQSAMPTPSVQPAGQAAVPTIRVDLDKLDRLVDTVGELVITQSMLAQRLQGAGVAAEDEVAQLEYLTRELQDCAMSLRAQPIRSVFSRVPRIVRELEGETGKKVKLVVEGEATELDKTVIERIGEPLTHLIRNAIDHGLETPDERVAAGKPEEGTVTLSAEHRGGRILICVADNGRGINRDRVLAKAVEKGIVAADAKLTNEEIDNLVFAPGFSTAQTVSNISGRGVGMDVVRQNIQALGGRVSIASRPGEGAIFSLALPLTLAIADGMIVKIGAETLILPLTHVVESLKPQAGDIMSMGPGRHMLNVRGRFMPIMPVARSLGFGDAIDNPEDAVMIVVETETMGQAVLMVDQICDQRQVVIKSLETNYRQVDGIAGATILGDGRIALIADIDALAIGCLRMFDQAA